MSKKDFFEGLKAQAKINAKKDQKIEDGLKTVEDKKVDICPQCGAPVEGNNSGECEYCHSTLINSNYTLVMSKKKMLSQK